MATYYEMAKKILDWSNRDSEVLSYNVIHDCINYAVDDAYRSLRIAPLEATQVYTIGNKVGDSDVNSLRIPTDLIEVIQLRKCDSNSITQYITYNAKADIRSFYNEEIKLSGYWGTSDYVFARERENLLVHPNIKDSEVYELYYYRRLPDVDARYVPDFTVLETNAQQYFDTDVENLYAQVREAEGEDIFTVNRNNYTQVYFDADSTNAWIGKEAPQWLRDQNEKVILYGALSRAMDYLGDMEATQRWDARFKEEIHELNQEDKMRMAKSGIVTTHFNGGGLI